MVYRYRPHQLICRVTEDERNKIFATMRACGYKTFSTYARRLLLSGHVFIIDWKELNKLKRQITGIATNINQVAYRANATRHVRQSDIDYLKSQMDEIIRLLNVYLDTYKRLDDLIIKTFG